MKDKNYYVLLVESRKEAVVKERLLEFLKEDDDILFPTRELFIRKRGKRFRTIAPLFKGYLFLKMDEVSGELLAIVKGMSGVFKFLNSNQDIKPLSQIDVKQLGSFLLKGYKASISKVIFNTNDRIVVKDGPLKEFEGRIVKVDKRKGRAKVELSMYKESHTIDFGFEDIGLS